MTPEPLRPDDPRLTAFVLGELAADEHAVVAAAVSQDPALQAAVAELRALTQEMTAALAAEPAPEVAPVELPVPASRPRRRIARVLRFPGLWMAGVAAAGLAVLVAVREERTPGRPRETVNRYELRLNETPQRASESEALPAQGPTAEEVEEIPGNAALTVPRSRGLPVPKPVAMTAERPAAAKVAVTGTILEAPRPPAFDLTLEDPAPMATTPSRMPSSDLAMPVNLDLQPRRPDVAPVPQLHSPSPLRKNYYHAVADAVTHEGGRAETGGGPEAETTPAAAMVRRPRPAEDFLPVAQFPRAVVPLQVGATSYFNVQRLIQAGQRPGPEVVRIEELLHHFPSAALPPGEEDVLATAVEVATAPWAPANRLVRIGMEAQPVAAPSTARLNLVLLIDVSGSMHKPDRMPLLQDALRSLLTRLHADDQVGLVTYAGGTETALVPTAVREEARLLNAIEHLRPAGTSNAGRGLRAAYELAEAHRLPGGDNRVLLCTDGDFNVGVTDPRELADLVQSREQRGVTLHVLAFGARAAADGRLAELAERGGGRLAAVTAAAEARPKLAELVGDAAPVVAEDVVMHVDWNPARVQSYRLLGYRPATGAAHAPVAADLRAGDRLTAYFEVIPLPDRPPPADLLASLQLTFSAQGAPRVVTLPVPDRPVAFAAASPDFRFGAAVAGFGLVLQQSPARGTATLEQVRHWAQGAVGRDVGGYRREFVQLLDQAISQGL